MANFLGQLRCSRDSDQPPDWVTAIDARICLITQSNTRVSVARNVGVTAASVIVRKSDYWYVGGHDPLLAQMQDWDLFLKLAMGGRRPALSPAPLVRYHLRESNASRKYRVATEERFSILLAHERRARSVGDTATLEAIILSRFPPQPPRSVEEMIALVAQMNELRPSAAAPVAADDDIVDPHRRDVMVMDEMVREEVPALVDIAVALWGMPSGDADAYARAAASPLGLRSPDP